jgi:hypothetical protein
MTESNRLNDDEVARLRRRRAGVRASLACEGMYLSAEEEALFEQFDREHLPTAERVKRLTAYSRARRAAKG